MTAILPRPSGRHQSLNQEKFKVWPANCAGSKV
jgi:hypothetical protein